MGKTIAPNDKITMILIGCGSQGRSNLRRFLRMDDVHLVAVCDVDPDRLRQVLSNLISNALQSTQAGGQITTRLAADESRVFISVIDTGPGIAPESEVGQGACFTISFPRQTTA